MVPTAISQIVEQVFNAFFSVYLAWVFMSINIPEGMTKNIPRHLPVVRWGRALALWQVWL